MIKNPQSAAEAAAFFSKYDLAALDAGRETRRFWNGEPDASALILTVDPPEEGFFGDAVGACIAGSEAVPCVRMNRGDKADRAEYIASLTEGTCCRVSPPPIFACDVRDADESAREYEELLDKIPGSDSAVAVLSGLLLPREAGRAVVAVRRAEELAAAEELLGRLGGIIMLPADDGELIRSALGTSASCVSLISPEKCALAETLAEIAASGKFYAGGLAKKKNEPLMNMFLRYLKASYSVGERRLGLFPVLRSSVLVSEEIKYAWREAFGIFRVAAEYN